MTAPQQPQGQAQRQQAANQAAAQAAGQQQQQAQQHQQVGAALAGAGLDGHRLIGLLSNPLFLQLIKIAIELAGGAIAGGTPGGTGTPPAAPQPTKP